MSSLVVAGNCGSTDLLRHVRPTISGHPTVIDLSRLRFIEPAGLVAVATLADDAAERGGVTFVSPDDDGVARYVSRMRLGTVLDSLDIAHDLPRVVEHDRRDALLELQRFDSQAIDRLAGIVYDTVAPHDPDAASVLHDGVVELASNVPAHARCEYGYLAAQKVYGGRALRFAVADAGVGMLSTLRPLGAEDDRTAITLAVQEGVTEHPEQSSGGGLSAVMTAVHAMCGQLFVMSGTSEAVFNPARPPRFRGHRPVFQGTCVQGTVHERTQR